MPQIVYNEIPTNENSENQWTIYVKKVTTKKEEKQYVDLSSYDNVHKYTIQTQKESLVKIADFDSFLSLNGKHESQVVQNAIEKGHFRSVNKIKKPDLFTIELAKGGSEQDIQLVLENLKKYKNGTELMIVSTPFGVVENLNLTNVDYSFRQGETAYMLIARLTFQEIQSGDLALEYTTAMVQDPQNTNTQDVGEKPLKEM